MDEILGSLNFKYRILGEILDTQNPTNKNKTW